MASLKEIRNRISSVNSTKKITSAMKMVSAAKFKKAQDNLSHYRPFFEENTQIIESIFKGGKVNNPYCVDRKIKKKIGIIVITSNSSMCGAFNQNVIRATLNESVRLDRTFSKCSIDYLCLGKRGYDFFNKKGFSTVPLNNHILDKPEIELTREAFNIITEKFLKGEYDSIYLIYNAFKNAAVQVQRVEKFLPYEVEKEEGYKSNIDIIEPDQNTFISKTLPNYLLYKLHFAIANSSAAEHGARMTAMHQATDNASELIKELTLQYNKARQASITKEILEIVSGANALKG